MVNLARVVSVSSRACRLNARAARAASSLGLGFWEAEAGSERRARLPDLGIVERRAENGSWGKVRGFHSIAARFGAEEGSDGPVTVDYSSQLSEKEFHNVANDTLHHLQEKIDELGEQLSIDGFDSDYAEGVLTVRLGDLGTYVINKQTPNRQIWLSSPVSGPARFDWQDSKWVYRRTKADLYNLLQKELSDLLGRSVNLSE